MYIDTPTYALHNFQRFFFNDTNWLSSDFLESLAFNQRAIEVLKGPTTKKHPGHLKHTIFGFSPLVSISHLGHLGLNRVRRTQQESRPLGPRAIGWSFHFPRRGSRIADLEKSASDPSLSRICWTWNGWKFLKRTWFVHHHVPRYPENRPGKNEEIPWSSYNFQGVFAVSFQGRVLVQHRGICFKIEKIYPNCPGKLQ